MNRAESVTVSTGGKSVTLTAESSRRIAGVLEKAKQSEGQKLTAVMSENERATMRALLDDLRIGQIDEAAMRANLKMAVSVTAEAQAALNSYCMGLCDPQEQLEFPAKEA